MRDRDVGRNSNARSCIAPGVAIFSGGVVSASPTGASVVLAEFPPPPPDEGAGLAALRLWDRQRSLPSVRTRLRSERWCVQSAPGRPGKADRQMHPDDLFELLERERLEPQSGRPHLQGRHGRAGGSRFTVAHGHQESEPLVAESMYDKADDTGEGASSHCTSSIATTIGLSGAHARRTFRVPVPR